MSIDISGALRTFWDDEQPKNFINGTWQASRQSEPTYNPSTGERIADSPDTQQDEVEQAIRAAEIAGETWKRLTISERADYLMNVRDRLDVYGEDIALLESIDSGNPMGSTRRDISLALRYLTEWVAQARTLAGRYTRPFHDGHSIVTYEPYGVVGKIIAYNHPMLFALAGSIYPLMAGNTMVVKTSAQTPLGTLALGQVLKDTLPPGVMNIIGGGVAAGDALVTSPRVKRIAFTGSDRTALTIQSRLSQSGMVKHFTAELGGKNAFVMFDDCDIEQAVEAAFAGLSLVVSAGQSCQATAKILVQETIIDEVAERLAKRMQRLTLGPAYDESTDMGPVVSTDHAQTVESYIQAGMTEGATLVTGGKRANIPGYFIEPTLFTGVTSNMKIAREEIFGPVAMLMPFTTEEDAITQANDTVYGLSAAIWTTNISRALRVSSEIKAGYVWVNDANRHYPGAPFGGMGASGVGREESIEEMLGFVEPKSINIKVENQ